MHTFNFYFIFIQLQIIIEKNELYGLMNGFIKIHKLY